MSLKLSTYLNTIYHTNVLKHVSFSPCFLEHISDHQTQHISRTRFHIYLLILYTYITHISSIHLNTKKHIMFLQSLQEINIYRFTIDLRLHFADSANKIFNLSCSNEGISWNKIQNTLQDIGLRASIRSKSFSPSEASNIYFPILLELTINHEIFAISSFTQ